MVGKCERFSERKTFVESAKVQQSQKIKLHKNISSSGSRV